MYVDLIQCRYNNVTSNLGRRSLLPQNLFNTSTLSERKLYIRFRPVVVSLCLLAMTLYVLWKLHGGLTSEFDPLFLSWLIVDFLALLLYITLTWELWNAERSTRKAQPEDVAWMARQSVTLLIPTRDESVEILRQTVQAAKNVQLVSSIYILDDGNRETVEGLAKTYGVKYLSRSSGIHAKAGNLNSAIKRIDEDFLVIIDADHIVHPEFVLRTLFHFVESDVAIVQTCQDFYNNDSFNHVSTLEDGNLHEQSFFHHVCQAGKHQHESAFWSGTGAVVRKSALQMVGGVATESLTEDILTSIRLYKCNLRTVFVNEVLTLGISPESYKQFYSQRLRWSIGLMQIWIKEKLPFTPGLNLKQRICFLSSVVSLSFLQVIIQVGAILLPALLILSGSSLGGIKPEVLSLGFFIYLSLNLVLERYLARGHRSYYIFQVLKLIEVLPLIEATTTLIFMKKIGFQVTKKGKTCSSTDYGKAPKILIFAFLVNLAAVIYAFLGNPAGENGPHVWQSLFYLIPLYYAISLLLAINRIISPQYQGEKRAATRFKTNLSTQLGQQSINVKQMSTEGLVLELDSLEGLTLPKILTLDNGSSKFRIALSSEKCIGENQVFVSIDMTDGSNQQEAFSCLFSPKLDQESQRVHKLDKSG